MDSVADAYMDALGNETTRLPLWFPGSPIALGDVGVLQKDGWQKHTSLATMGIPFEVQHDETPNAVLNLGSATVSGVSLDGKGQFDPPNIPVADAKVGLSLGFSGAGEFLLRAMAFSVQGIANLHEVEREVLDRAKQQDQWRPEWIFVTEVMVAERSIAAVAKSSNAEVILDLGVSATSPVLELGELSLTSKVLRQRNMAAMSLSLYPDVLTYRARRVEKGWWWTKQINPVLGVIANSHDENKPELVDVTLADATRVYGADPDSP